MTTLSPLLPWLLAAILAIVVLWLWKVSRRKDANLRLLLEALENADTSLRFLQRKQVNRTLNRISAILAEMRIKVEQQEHYNELILNFVETGIMVVDAQGYVRRHNSKALKMLGLQVLTHTSQLNRVQPGLTEKVNQSRPGERLSIGPELNITLQVAGIKLGGHELRVFSLTDIGRELGAREAEAWTQLSRTLAHEIMNSLAPIISLSDTLQTLPAECDEERKLGLETIGETGRSLMKFVENYRQVARMPQPHPQTFAVADMLSHIATLMPRISWECPPDMTLYADPDMITRVIINLCTNAFQAGATTVQIKAADSRTIEVSNDGDSIPEALAAEIFTPFFTTRPEGSGIGLSLSRQIMARSGGTLSLISASRPVTFRINFP